MKVVSGIVPAREIEDVVQDTYVRIIQSEQLDCIKQPKSYIYRTAVNLAKDHVKTARYRLAEPYGELDFVQEDATPTDTVYHTSATDQEFALFCDVVSELPEQCRRVFVLRKVYGFSQQEIADTLNISISTIEKHVANGMKRVVMQSRHRNNHQTRGEDNE